MAETRVLQVLGRSAGGIARHVAQVTEALDGHRDLLIDVAAPRDLPLEMPKPAINLSIPDGLAGGHIRAMLHLRLIAAEGGYDVVHAHGIRAGIDCGVALKGRRPKLITTVHNLVRPEIVGGARSVLFRQGEGLVVRLSQHVFAVSGEMTEHLRRSADPTKLETLYLGVGTAPAVERTKASVRRELGLQKGRSLVVTASRLAKQKDLPVMLEAVKRLSADAVLGVLGVGPLETELRAEARSLGIEPRVKWLGFKHNVADYVSAADVFCLSSTWEGIPLSVQEAILLGTPVVATAVGGMPEIVTDRETGRLVPPSDPDSLAKALDEVLLDGAARKRYATAARIHLSERFSTARMLDRLESAYKEASHGA
ncbi:MAG TPA: glycosyltransferase family 4 protein [Actinomycetota bacterium]|nr:glycosyltransferase family 4 protein [Actinomycetota bacterium]